MLESIANIESFLAEDMTFDSFVSNKLLCHAVIYNLQCIGESAYMLSKAVPDLSASRPRRRLSFLGHDFAAFSGLGFDTTIRPRQVVGGGAVDFHMLRVVVRNISETECECKVLKCIPLKININVDTICFVVSRCLRAIRGMPICRFLSATIFPLTIHKACNTSFFGRRARGT